MIINILSFINHNEKINSMNEDLDIEEQKQQIKFDLFDISKTIQLIFENIIIMKIIIIYNKYISLSYLYDDSIAILLI